MRRNNYVSGWRSVMGWGKMIPIFLSLFLLPMAEKSALAQNVSSDIQIISPVNGWVVAPGQTITVAVSIKAGTSFVGGIQVIAENIGISEPKIDPPFEFSFTIPKDAIGQKKITALGITGSDRGLLSQSVIIDIEPLTPLAQLSVSPTLISFGSVGEQIPLTVTGTFTDGSKLDITKSARTMYSSADITIATVSSYGLVTAVGAGLGGSTRIIVQYASQSVSIPVSVVPRPIIAVTASPGILWPPDNRMVQVTISGSIQDEGGGINLSTVKFSVSDEYKSIQHGGTVNLASDGSYSFAIWLEASRHGDDINGRRYMIVVSAKDNAGNLGTGSTLVVVPHDQRRQ
jgi:hypothetical protein